MIARSLPLSRRALVASALALSVMGAAPARAQNPSEIRVDYATYNQVSLVLKERKLLEKEFEKDKINVRWVFSAGSNKALEFLNAGSIDIGSTAGAAALVARINGNPVKSVGVFSRPEWTALVTGGKSTIAKVEDLKGKKVAVTRGTDPHIFLVRALDKAGLTEKDVRLVLLQHADGKTALVRGDVDAWAGLDPIMAQAELDDGAKLLYRKAEDNTWGILNTRDDFAAKHPELVKRVLKVYEEARLWAVANPAEFRKLLVAETKLPDPIIARQLERTDLTHPAITADTTETILQAGLALQKAGVVKADVDVKAVVGALIDTRFAVAGK
ncbi:MAG: aliphatic sulfonate ABC transporter substrate-binding protein [Beijerinckiaceae bacterium]|nr:aliphatic sulfonate ABC transporter substrate-binding protein [Beijerinckiaceae bacterium]